MAASPALILDELLNHFDSLLLHKLTNGVADLLLVRSQDARSAECFVAIKK